VGSIDLSENEKADVSIVVPRDAVWSEQEETVVSKVGESLAGEKLDAVICVAGGRPTPTTHHNPLSQSHNLPFRLEFVVVA